MEDVSKLTLFVVGILGAVVLGAAFVVALGLVVWGAWHLFGLPDATGVSLGFWNSLGVAFILRLITASAVNRGE